MYLWIKLFNVILLHRVLLLVLGSLHDIMSTVSSTKTPLPPGWVKCHSKSYPGYFYYFNLSTRARTWQRPVLEEETKSPEQPESKVSWLHEYVWFVCCCATCGSFFVHNNRLLLVWTNFTFTMSFSVAFSLLPIVNSKFRTLYFITKCS